jgi:lysozyme
MVNVERLQKQLIKHEGMRLFPYVDTVGKVTIGVGHNLTDRGLNSTVVTQLLNDDIYVAVREISKFSWYPLLNEVRQRALIDMMFNIGAVRFREFKHMIDALEKENFDEAAHQMLESKWAEQVGIRANTLANMVKTGEDHV